jgi:hypothetical protein
MLCLRTADVLLSELSTQRCDLVLQRRNHVRMLLFCPCHTSFHFANVLPYIDLASHDFSYAATTAAMA